MATCPQCKSAIDAKDLFCGECGHDLRSTVLEAATTRTPAAPSGSIEQDPSQTEAPMPDRTRKGWVWAAMQAVVWGLAAFGVLSFYSRFIGLGTNLRFEDMIQYAGLVALSRLVWYGIVERWMKRRS